MLFNSVTFAIFLPLVLVLYWSLVTKGLRFQNLLLLVASYYFYACWNWRFLFLLIFSTVLDYYTGLKMADAQSAKLKKFWFWLSISVNIGFLGIFKYYNFFASSFGAALSAFGFQTDPIMINVILPVGISFYTFHGLSYVIDIYYDRIKPEKNFVDYSLFVSFFPLLVAGPIERATHLLPQLKTQRTFNYRESVDGLRQILWGLFKKIVIADQCAEFANNIFNSSDQHSGSTLVVGAIFFTFQIYGDFSGYSDIAIGTAKLFGIDLLRNFAFPYFSRNIAEFWRRWHISLSTWFRDYLYIPLGGSKGGTRAKVRNTFIIFLVSGFWHGANWTFIVWGLLNALFIMPSIVLGTNRNNLDIVAQGRLFPTIRELFSLLITFSLIVFSWIFFRAKNIEHAFAYLSGIFDRSLFSIPQISNSKGAAVLSIFILLLLVIEWSGREKQFAIQHLDQRWQKAQRLALYYSLTLCVIIFYGTKQEFIYFQF